MKYIRIEMNVDKMQPNKEAFFLNRILLAYKKNHIPIENHIPISRFWSK